MMFALGFACGAIAATAAIGAWSVRWVFRHMTGEAFYD
jgi:hypothetical protein